MAKLPDRRDDADRVLIAQIAEGSHEAFHGLMGRHLPFVLELAQRLVGRRADADEIAQEAFLRVWTRAPHWRADGEAKFRTWLYRVVVNLCLDRRRQRVSLPLEEADAICDPAPDGLEQAARGEISRLVARALDGLPAKQRAAIILCYYSEVGGEEAARLLNVSQSALESLLVRARKGLRQRMDALLEGKGTER